MAGLITFNPTGATAGGCGLILTFNKPYSAAPKAVILTPSTNNSTSVGAFVSATQTTFSIQMNGTPTSGFSYGWYYLIIE